MTIRIVEDERDAIYLTQSEYDLLKHEYGKAMQFYAGPIPTLETWIRRQRKYAKDAGFDLLKIKESA